MKRTSTLEPTVESCMKTRWKEKTEYLTTVREVGIKELRFMSETKASGDRSGIQDLLLAKHHKMI